MKESSCDDSASFSEGLNKLLHVRAGCRRIGVLDSDPARFKYCNVPDRSPALRAWFTGARRGRSLRHPTQSAPAGLNASSPILVYKKAGGGFGGRGPKPKSDARIPKEARNPKPQRLTALRRLAARSKTVAALCERRRNCAFWPDFGGHRPPLQLHLEFLNGLLRRCSRSRQHAQTTTILPAGQCRAFGVRISFALRASGFGFPFPLPGIAP